MICLNPGLLVSPRKSEWQLFLKLSNILSVSYMLIYTVMTEAPFLPYLIEVDPLRLCLKSRLRSI
jgi:hypothetical protein